MGSAEVFGSEPNSSAALSHCLAMNRSKFRFYEPQTKANCACLCATRFAALLTIKSSADRNPTRPERPRTGKLRDRLGVMASQIPPRKAGGLMIGAASKAVPQTVRFGSMPAPIGTPKGLPLSSRGQGGRRVRPRSNGYRGGSRTAPTFPVFPSVGFTYGYSRCTPCGEPDNGQTSSRRTGQTSGLPQGLLGGIPL